MSDKKAVGRQARPFWSQVYFGGEVKSPHVDTPCWEWMAYKNRDGYGQARKDGRMQKAHRVAWEMENGPIPGGVCILHTCDNKCVRPDHMTLGSHADNMHDMARKGRSHQKTKTHCPSGHEYAPGNTYLYKGRRLCKRCMKRHDAKYKAANRGS